MLFAKLVWRNLVRHPLRSALTMASLVVALFLMCILRSLVTSLERVSEDSRSDRLWVQSAVSLFVDLPLSYAPKIAAVEGVENTCKWQWFGGYYQTVDNFFGQFAVEPESLLDMYPEIVIADGSRDAFLGERRACLVGKQLAEQFEWRIGQTIPLIGALFPHPEGIDVPWEFRLAATYESTAANVDERTFFFHWDYFEETLEAGGDPVGLGTVVLTIEPGVEATRVMAEVDALFENGPQRVQTTTESEFQAQFVSMFGNVPLLLQSIGGGVLFAVLLACINTMLLASREQTHDFGILQALGFRSARLSALSLAQAIVLCGVGGGLGIALALGIEAPLADLTAPFFPNFHIVPSTVVAAAVAVLVIGLVAGLAPAVRVSRLRPVDALGATD